MEVLFPTTFYTKRGCEKTIQSKCLEPPYYLLGIFTILVEDSEESMPTVISNFLDVIEKSSLNKSILLCQQGAFFHY